MSSYFHASQPRPRPSWWTPENVLTALRSGEPATAICLRAHVDCEGRISASTLRTDISKWTNSATWGEQFVAAQALLRNDGAGGFVITKDWYDDFFAAMDSTDGNIERACELACVSVKLVYAVSGDKRSKNYDSEFAERLRVAESPRHHRIRENVLRMAEVDSADGARVGMKVLESALPALHAPKQQVEVSGEIDHLHSHEHRVRMLPAEVVAASAARNYVIRRVERVERVALDSDTGGRRTIDVTATSRDTKQRVTVSPVPPVSSSTPSNE